MSSPATPTSLKQVFSDEVLLSAGRSVVSIAALHGGAVQFSIGGIELALVDILDLRHVVATSVFPAQSLERLNTF